MSLPDLKDVAGALIKVRAGLTPKQVSDLLQLLAPPEMVTLEEIHIHFSRPEFADKEIN